MAFFFHNPRGRSQPKPQLPTPLPGKIISGIDADLQEVRDCIRSAADAVREQKRRKNKNLVRHWQNMLSILRESERDLVAIRREWERRATD